VGSESLVVLFLVSGSRCSLLAPSESELSGAWGVGGQGLPASGSGAKRTMLGKRACQSNSLAQSANLPVPATLESM
jgi:hypothetical protein